MGAPALSNSHIRVAGESESKPVSLTGHADAPIGPLPSQRALEIWEGNKKRPTKFHPGLVHPLLLASTSTTTTHIHQHSQINSTWLSDARIYEISDRLSSERRQR
jgi:hypothetical protein